MAFFVISEEPAGFALIGYSPSSHAANLLAVEARNADAIAPERVRIVDGSNLAALEALPVCMACDNPAAASAMLAAFDRLYRPNGIDDAAEGMERLRNQREFIILAYPGKESTPAEIAEQWRGDVRSRDAGELNADALATVAVLYAFANASYLANGLRGIDWREFDLYEESPTWRLYIEERRPESD